MDVILTEDIPMLGNAGDVVKVSNGYARNFLFPRKKAVKARAESLKALEHDKQRLQQQQDKLAQEAQELAAKIEEMTCTVKKQTGEEGKLFGAVTSADIEEALKKQDVIVDRKKIVLEEPIKNVGSYTVSLKLHHDVVAQLNLVVDKE